MNGTYNIVFLGLTLSSSWGNGHATTFRALIRGLAAEGQRVLFLERDVPWYANARDLNDPDFCDLDYYADLDDLLSRFGATLEEAGTVIIGSYVPAGVAVIDLVSALRPKRLFFYDIDTPVTLAKISREDEEYIARRQFPLFDAYLSFAGGPVLDRLEDDLGVQRAEAFYCSVDDGFYQPTGEAPMWDLGYLGTYSPDRQPVLERLLIEPARRLPQMRFVVAGPQYPPEIEWPDNVERIEHLPPSAHASFYSRQRFTLNVTREDMVALGWSPSVRLFEAAACQTPVISDEWEGLSDLLPEGEAILIARSTADVVQMLTEVDDASRQALAAAAAGIVGADHTGLARARELMRIIGNNNSRDQLAITDAMLQSRIA